MKIKEGILPTLLNEQHADVRSKLISFMSTVDHEFINEDADFSEDDVYEYIHDLPEHIEYYDGYAIIAVHSGRVTLCALGGSLGNIGSTDIRSLYTDNLSLLYSLIIENEKFTSDE